MCSGLYVAMALAICLMQPVTAIDTVSPFASAFLAHLPSGAAGASFQTLFLATSARFVSFGAVTGTVLPCSPQPHGPGHVAV